MRLPRAEDEVVLFIDVDGESVRAEGRVQRVRLSTGIDFDRRAGQVRNRRVTGEITVALRMMVPAAELEDPASPEFIEISGDDGVIRILEVGREVPPGT